MKPSKKKLELKKQRVRELTTEDQQRVVGGQKNSQACYEGDNDTSRCATTNA